MRFINRTFTFTDGLEAVSGVVQVCVNKRYGYVCADNWDNREAEVVCRSYSSSYQSPYFGMHLSILIRNALFYTLAFSQRT